MKHLYVISDQVLSTDYLTPQGRLAELIEALEFVTTDDWAQRYDDYDLWEIHSRVMDEFFADTNDGDACDWTWEEVLPYWDIDDLVLAYQLWEDTYSSDELEAA